MRTIRVGLYTFGELSEKAKEKAISKYRNINVDFDWWESVYDDAERAGLKITGLDLDRNRHATGKFIESAPEAANKIIADHGKDCETHKTAKAFLSDWSELVTKYSDGIKTDEVHEDNEYEFDQEANELEAEFLKSLLEDYSMMLQREYEYQTEDEQVAETIRANGFEFTEDGEGA